MHETYFVSIEGKRKKYIFEAANCERRTACVCVIRNQWELWTWKQHSRMNSNIQCIAMQWMQWKEKTWRNKE